MTTNTSNILTAKVVMLGESGVGKTYEEVLVFNVQCNLASFYARHYSNSYKSNSWGLIFDEKPNN